MWHQVNQFHRDEEHDEETVIRFSCLQLFQDNPIGDWDGVIDGKLLCNFASLEHTRLVPICDVMPGESPSICPSFLHHAYVIKA